MPMEEVDDGREWMGWRAQVRVSVLLAASRAGDCESGSGAHVVKVLCPTWWWTAHHRRLARGLASRAGPAVPAAVVIADADAHNDIMVVVDVVVVVDVAAL